MGAGRSAAKTGTKIKYLTLVHPPLVRLTLGRVVQSSKSTLLKKSCLFIPLSLLAFIILIALASFISNLNLPQHSTLVDQLSELEKARLSEVLHLRSTLGESTWPGFSQADIPLIVYNEKYAFLVGYPNPPDGWRKIPSLEQRGGVWEQVPGDLFEGHPYYRTLITDPQKTPQAFTVLVGERWVATFMTREYGQVEFYRGFRQDFPPLISNLIPVRLAWIWLMGKTENHIAALEHESFHAYQGMVAQVKLTQAESMYDVESSYPYDGMKESWYQEMNLLVQAARSKSNTDATNLARQFLQARTSRRAGLNDAQVKLERLREWEEGLAKYAELDIVRRAGDENAYTPVEGLSQDKDFHRYQNQQAFWSEQLGEAKNPNISGDTRFYYSGNALAVVLDRLMPGWKPKALPGGEFLDNLLREAVK
jgi:hypothetical protein